MSNNAAIVDISQTANKFRSSIVLQAENKYIDVKSILGLIHNVGWRTFLRAACSWPRC